MNNYEYLKCSIFFLFSSVSWSRHGLKFHPCPLVGFYFSQTVLKKAPHKLSFMWLTGLNWDFTHWYMCFSCWIEALGNWHNLLCVIYIYIPKPESGSYLFCLKLHLDVSKDWEIETVNLLECIMVSNIGNQWRLHSDYGCPIDKKW